MKIDHKAIPFVLNIVLFFAILAVAMWDISRKTPSGDVVIPTAHAKTK